MINEGKVDQGDHADMEKWLLSEDGLILCVPALFGDASFELTARLLNHILRIREDLTIASPRTPNDIQLRHAYLISNNQTFQSKVSYKTHELFQKNIYLKNYDLL